MAISHLVANGLTSVPRPFDLDLKLPATILPTGTMTGTACGFADRLVQKVPQVREVTHFQSVRFTSGDWASAR
jgi:hypothetical protein